MTHDPHGSNAASAQLVGTTKVKTGFAEMFKGGVIMDVVTADQARIAEQAGATSVMALERVPADIRAQGGVARMSDPSLIEDILGAVSIPVMAKVRIGHFVEAQILQSMGVDFIDESEVLTPADEAYHIDKRAFTVPFVCGATNIGEALRRIGEGAAMIRTKGEAGTGNVVEAVRHARAVLGEIRALQATPREELMTYAKNNGAPYDLVVYVHEHGKLPVVNFAAGGIATPADAALMMQLGVEGVFVGSGIFKAAASETDLAKKHAAWSRRAEAIVKATTHYNDPMILAEVSKGLGEAMVGIEIDTLPESELLAKRGW
jgi:pyridoxal 5'-phosphate synthase pdxS subunit